MATTLSLTIAAGSALSNPLSIAHGLRITRIGMPSGWDAAPLTFLMSLDGATWLDLYHAAEGASGMFAPYETGVQSVVANSILSLPADAGSGIDWIRFRSGTKSQPVNQAADRTFAVVFE